MISGNPEESVQLLDIPESVSTRAMVGAAGCLTGEALYPFCPTGDPHGRIPSMKATNRISVYRLQAPVWEFKYGDLLAKVHIMHDDLHWSQNGTLNGYHWGHVQRHGPDDNQMGIYYETWTVCSDPGTNDTVWFESFDCSQFVHRTYRTLASLGAQLLSRTQTNYTKRGAQPPGQRQLHLRPPAMQNLATDIRKFYYSFRPHQSYVDFALSLVDIYEKVVVHKNFYLYYNSEYWHLPMKPPYMQIIYEEATLIRSRIFCLRSVCLQM
ncbi:hypothetical protein CRUP_036218 [Coryphaenoides rupestris]|nr:hypothetical protein CRUP_036218 [Coryphaenoides rupestris]